MADATVDSSDIARYLTLLESADQAISVQHAQLLKATADALVEVAQETAHKVTGFMASSIHQLGPFALGGGVLESQIASAASYTDMEIARGGDHDWASGTVEAQGETLETLGERAAQIIGSAMGDRSSG